MTTSAIVITFETDDVQWATAFRDAVELDVQMRLGDHQAPWDVINKHIRLAQVNLHKDTRQLGQAGYRP